MSKSVPKTEDLLLRAVGLRKCLGQAGGVDPTIVANFDVDVRRGKITALFGPNGCGKTTLLNMFGGLLVPDAGNVTHFECSPFTLESAYMMQNFSDTLFPWRTVFENVRLPLEFNGNLTERDRDNLALLQLKRFGLEESDKLYPHQISGGMKQSLALARAMIHTPSLLLLDEPFSSMDYSVSRLKWLILREEIDTMRAGAIVVSHDVDEAVFLADYILVCSKRPTRILERISVDFGSKRELSLLQESAFFEIRSKVLSAFDKAAYD